MSYLDSMNIKYQSGGNGAAESQGVNQFAIN